MRYQPKVTSAVQWHEGMLLGPQHFQQATLRSEQLLAHGLRALQPYCWGVSHCRVDAMELSNGRLRISELEALMPDGTLIQFGPADKEELALDLVDRMDLLKQGNQRVWLCIPMHHGELLTTDRYKSVEEEAVADQNVGDNSIQIPRLRPRVTLMLGDAPPARFSALPVLLLGYHNESVREEEFIAPTVRVTPHSPLSEWLTGIMVQAREKAGFIADQIRSDSRTIRNNHPALYDPTRILQGLVTPLLALEELLHSGVAHPHTLYLHFCQFAAQLAASSAVVVPPLFAAYDHDDIRASFLPVCAFVQEILDTIQESFQVVSFKYEEGRFSLYPEPEWIEDHFIIGLRCNDRSSLDDTERWGDSCTIGSFDKVDSLLLRRILGAERKRIEQEPSIGLSAPDGVVLFQVKCVPDFIDPEEGLCILNEQRGGSMPREILFYVKR